MIRHRRVRRSHPSPSSISKHDEDLKIDSKLKSIFLLSMEREISQCVLGYPAIQPNLQFEEFLGGLLEEEDIYNKYRIGGEHSMRRSYQATEKVAKIWIDENKGVLCSRFPYQAEVIDKIRNQIPKGKKSWNPELGLWEFSIECIDLIVEILSQSFSDLINLTDLISVPPQNGTKDILLSILDKDDHNLIYRLLAKKYHPDLNQGDGEMMAKINVIFKIK